MHHLSRRLLSYCARIPRADIALSCVAGGLVLLGSQPVVAGPSGPTYDKTQVSIGKQGSTTTISQKSNQAVIDWQSFDVGRSETVRFNQPGASSATLNRVHAGRESVIAGGISAPGQVIIQNSNGVVFTPTAKVDVGSLVATSIGISNQNFAAGKLIFDQPGKPQAAVRNQGTITVASKGLAALVAPVVANSGSITARTGAVVMAAGTAATLDLHGDGLVSVAVTDPVTRQPRGLQALVDQGGVIRVDGGSVVLTAQAAADVVNTAINMTGVIQARGSLSRDGKVALVGASVQVAGSIDASASEGGRAGTVHVLGDQVALTGDSRIDASGGSGGGTVLIGGDLQGQPRGGAVGYGATATGDTTITTGSTAPGSGEMPRAKRVTVKSGARIAADGTDDGNGGKIVVWSDGEARFDGSASAKGTGSGRGGVVETSAKGRLAIGDSAQVSTDSPAGAGTWLIDPTAIKVVASGGSAGSVDAANRAGGMSTISASTIVSALAGGSITLVASDQVTVDAPIVAFVLGGAPNGLQLIADGSDGRVDVNAPIRLANGNLAIRAIKAITLGDAATLDVGAGTVWLQTSQDGSIAQTSGSAVLAGGLAAIGGSVDLPSWGNSVGTLAGLSLNGGFRFNQTNAAGTTNIGTVTDPFAPARAIGVAAQMSMDRGSQIFEAQSPGGGAIITLAAGGQTFDRIVFTAIPYGQVPNTTPRQIDDSSDYFVEQVVYTTVTGMPGNWTMRPQTPAQSTPAGFSVTTPVGMMVNDGNRWGVRAFTSPGPTNQNEIQLNVRTGETESAAMALGGATRSVTATFSQLYNPEFGVWIERGMAQFFQTVAGVPVIAARSLPPINPPPVTSPNVGPPPLPQSIPGSIEPPIAASPVVPAILAGIAPAALPVGTTEPLFRGRDPDTPSDAVWRTTPMENPFVENPFYRSYSLGTIQLATEQLTPEQLGRLSTAAGGTTPQPFAEAAGPKRIGQHGDRTGAPLLDVDPTNIGVDPIATALARIAPAAGPGGAARGRSGGCSAGGFLGDFWACGPAGTR